MSRQSFLKQLGIGSAVLAILLLLLHQLPAFQSFQMLSWISISFFVLLSILMYELGYRASFSSNKFAFTNIVIVFMVGKMLFSVVLIVVFSKLARPESRWFLVPFFAIYLFYTIYETYFMMKLGKMKPDQQK